MKFTKGDWKVSGDSIVTDDYCIATIETDGGYEAPERDGNKHLISASPIGMEMAELVVKLVRDHQSVDVKLVSLANKFMSKLYEQSQ